MQNRKIKNILQFNRFFNNKFNNVFEKHNSHKLGKDELLPMHIVRENIMKNLGLHTNYEPSPKPRDYLLKYEPKFKDLPPRSMQDSFTSAIISLSKISKLQRRYVSQTGLALRNGRLLEDMDIFACWVCHKHLCLPKFDNTKIPLPYTFVTLLVDETQFLHRTKYNLDIRLSGHVSWVGRSSMEIVVWLEQIDKNGDLIKIIRALFLMAARNAINTKSAPVNPIKPLNAYEKNIFDGGNERKRKRMESFKKSTLNVEPNDIEQQILHDLFMKTMNKKSMLIYYDELPKSYVWIHDTKILQTTPCYPDKLNVQNTIFGGYLMRIAVETAFICAHKFSGTQPYLTNICEIVFRKPIFVTSFIEMTSHIIYTNGTKMQILTTTDVLNFDSNNNNNFKSETTNIFQFTFETINNKPVNYVIPRTYKEAMWYIDGRRKLLATIECEE